MVMNNLLRFPQPTPRPATVATALDAVLAFTDAGIMAGRKEDYSTFERELHSRMMALERRFLGEKLRAMDVDESELLIDGVLHRRVIRSAQTYMTAAGEVCVERALYRPRSDPDAMVVAALDKEVGVVDGFLTPEAAALALYVVTELTPDLLT
jgi:hypothetical protein